MRGVFLACKHGLRVLGDGGSVVIVSGVAGLRADAGTSAYAAVAEHAQVGLMRSVAKEAAPRVHPREQRSIPGRSRTTSGPAPGEHA